MSRIPRWATIFVWGSEAFGVCKACMHIRQTHFTLRGFYVIVGLEDHSHNRVALSTSSSFLNLGEHLHAQDSPLNIWRNATVTALLAFISPWGESACMQAFLYKIKRGVFVYVYMCTCVHTHHVHTQECPWRLEERVGCLGTELEAVVSHPAWDVNSDPCD